MFRLCKEISILSLLNFSLHMLDVEQRSTKALF